MTALTALDTGTWRAVARLHRPALFVWGGFVLLTAGVLLWTLEVRVPEERAGTAGYFFLTDANNVWNFLSEVITYVTCAVAAWAGAALVGRELENGTARLAWTQGLSPARWLTANLVVPAAVITAGSLALVLCYDWAWSAGAGDWVVVEWYQTRVFISRGPVAVALPLLGLAAGALAGVALRRTLPALAVAVGLALGLRLLYGTVLLHLWPTRSFWPLQLSGTALLLAIAAFHTLLAFRVLARRTA